MRESDCHNPPLNPCIKCDKKHICIQGLACFMFVIWDNFGVAPIGDIKLLRRIPHSKWYDYEN